MNVQQHIMPQLQDLYQGLEKEFSPLKLCARVNTIFEFLQENEDLELAQYIKPLQEVAIVRLLKQVSPALSAFQGSVWVQWHIYCWSVYIITGFSSVPDCGVQATLVISAICHRVSTGKSHSRCCFGKWTTGMYMCWLLQGPPVCKACIDLWISLQWFHLHCVK